MRPTSPFIRIRLSQMLATRYRLGPEAAMKTANDLIELLRAADLEIVHTNWVNETGPTDRVDFWDGVSALHDLMKDSDWTPWKP